MRGHYAAALSSCHWDAGAGGNTQAQAPPIPEETKAPNSPPSQEGSFGRASMGTPGLVSDSTKQDIENVKAARDKFEKEKEALHAWRTKHKVDAAGFV